jgi:hypothetical protein
MSNRMRRAVGAAAIILALAFVFWITAVITSQLPQTFVVAVNVHGLDINPGAGSTQRPAPLSLSVLADAQQDGSAPTSAPAGTPSPTRAVPTPTPRQSPTPTSSPTPSPSPSLPVPTPTPTGLATITGQVVDSQTRNPIAGATVTANPGGYATVTDTSGNFSLAVAPGTYTVVASAALYNSASTSVTIKAGQKLNLILKLTSTTSFGSISGTVLDSVTKAPVVGATVSLSNGLVRVTDTNGSFSYSLVLTGSYTLTVSALGYVTQTNPVSVKAGHTTTVQILLVK